MNCNKVCPNLALLFLTLIFLACAGKKEDLQEHGTHDDESEWEQMDNFHVIMAETFHPFKDSANLEPVKTRAGELLAAAEKWIAAPLPAKVDNDAIKSKLEKLRSEASVLATTVKSFDDTAIEEQLTQLHDTFHEIQEAWYGGHD